jgi:hypothetical protein
VYVRDRSPAAELLALDSGDTSLDFLLAAVVAAIISFGVWRSDSAAAPTQRLCAAVGSLSIVALVVLGSAWPSIYTVAAILALPAGAMLLVRSPNPVRFRNRWTRAYIRIAVALPPLAFAFQFWWLSGGCKTLGKCA